MRRAPFAIAVVTAALLAAPAAHAGDVDEDGEGEGGPSARARLEIELRGATTASARLSAVTQEYVNRRADRVRLSREPLAAAAGRWTALGPADGAGRITALATHPTVAGTLYAGSAAGGVFRSTDGGTSWVAITDDLPALSVGALALAPSDPSVVYVGTGEGSLPGAFVPGIGLVRSTDGGASWILPPSVAATQFFRLSVHPRAANVLLAATEVGGLRSTDGGATFTTVIPRGAYGLVTDLARDPRRPETVYAATWCAVPCAAGSGRVLKSTDDGLTWIEKSAGLAFPAGMDADNQRIALALAPSGADTLYAATSHESGDVTVSHVFKSTNGGDTWTDLPAVARSVDASLRAYLGEQAWYDNAITVSPSDPDSVIAGGVTLVRSTDGGVSFAYPPLRGAVVHHDVHDLAWQGATLYIATDGGVYRTDDVGETASERNRGLGTRQYYAVAVNAANPEQLLAGAQDNGTDQRIAGAFRSVLSGDGFDTFYDPTNPRTAYATRQFGAIYRSDAADQSAPGFREITPTYAKAGDAAPFRTLLATDPLNPSRLFTAGARVWTSEDGGGTWSALAPVSADAAPVTALSVLGQVIACAKGGAVYRSEDGGASWRRGDAGLPRDRVNGLTIDPRAPGTMWAATAAAAGLFRSTDGGATWTPSGAGLPPFATYVVRGDPTDANVLLCGTDAGIHRSLDAGATWTRLGAGLPAAPVRDIRVLAGGAIVVATHGRGLWRLDAAPLPAPGAAQVPRWLIAGMAYTDGAGGTFWQSDFSVFNPHATLPMSLSLAFLDARDGGATLVWRPITVAPRETKAFTNVLGGPPFALPRGSYGALVVRGDDVPATPVFSGRTYNSGATSGTFGLSLPAVPIWPALAPLVSAAPPDTLIGLRDVPGSSRTNLVLANTGSDTASAEIELLDELGRPLGTKLRVDLAPWGVKQLNRVLTAAPPAGAGYAGTASSFVAKVTRLSGDVYPYATVIDERSSDPILVTPPRRVAAAYRLPGIVRTPGRNGTFFVSDVVLHNPSSRARSLALRYQYRVSRPGAPASELRSKAATISLAPGETLDMQDFVRSFLAGSPDLETGAFASSLLDVSADGEEPVLIVGRTYNATPAGNVGFAVPGFTPADGAAAGRRLVLAGLTSGAGYRTNAAFFLLGDGDARATATVVDKRGTVIATRAVALDASSPFVQVNDGDLFAGTQPGDGLAVILDVTGGSAAVGGYATVIDNLSGDAVLVAAEPGS